MLAWLSRYCGTDLYVRIFSTIKLIRQEMDIFKYRNALVSDYSDYISSFVSIRDERIKTVAQEELKADLLWPDPLIQLNPAFEPAATVASLAKTGVLHKECSKIFALNKTPSSEGKPLRLYTHQEEATTQSRPNPSCASLSVLSGARSNGIG